jgi:small subunit ribosomal protein S4
MGSPKFSKKKYATPLHPWKENRIESERELIKKYGLKNHKEVWKAKTYLGRYRQQARELLAKIVGKDPQIKKESEQLLLHLTKMGILPKGSSLDDVLALETESILSRRLQTLVFLKGFSSTTNQSRQLINHGHIAIGNRKVTIPSYIVSKDEENDIGYTNRSPLTELSHPARPKADAFKSGITDLKTEKIEEEPKPVMKKEKPKKKVEEKDKEITKSKEEARKSEEKIEGKQKLDKEPEKQEKKSQEKTEEKPKEKSFPKAENPKELKDEKKEDK